MASGSDEEINVDVCDNLAVSVEEGVEVQTILQGQAGPGDLDFIVQEEVETTTDGVLAADLDPVDNVIIALQNTDQDPSAVVQYMTGNDADDVSDQEMLNSSSSKRKRKSSSKSNSKKKARKGRKGVRFINRRFPLALATSQSVKEAKESNEASFDPTKRSRHWSRQKMPIKTLDGGQFTVSLWTTGMRGWIT
jgi:hypothetical protein